MSYTIKRCPVCSQFIHIHKRRGKRILKNVCEHIPFGPTTEKNIQEMFQRDRNGV